MKDKHFNFTEKSLALIPIPEKGAKPVTYYDSGSKYGLCVIVTYGGSKTYYFYMKHNGRPVRIKIGRVGEKKLFTARQEAEDMRQMAAHGQKPSNKRQIDLKDITLQTFFEEYYWPRHCCVDLTKNTQKSYGNILKNHLSPLYKTKLLSITKADIQLLYNDIKNNTGLHTANRMLAVVRNMYNKAIEWEIIPYNSPNPAAKVKKEAERHRVRWLSKEELGRLFAALDTEPNDTFRNFVLLSLFLGQRRNNMLSMRWENVDLKKGSVFFPKTKNGEPLELRLTEQAAALLQQMSERRNSDWLFPSTTSASGHYEEPKKAWKSLLERASIKNMRLHDLRHTMASYQVSSGSTLPIVQKSLGHKTIAATQMYAHVLPDPVLESMQRATDKMLSFATNKQDLS